MYIFVLIFEHSRLVASLSKTIAQFLNIWTNIKIMTFRNMFGGECFCPHSQFLDFFAFSFFTFLAFVWWSDVEYRNGKMFSYVCADPWNEFLKRKNICNWIGYETRNFEQKKTQLYETDIEATLINYLYPDFHFLPKLSPQFCLDLFNALFFSSCLCLVYEIS